MSFQDDVRNARESVLRDPKYKGPIDFLNERVHKYQVEKIQTPMQVQNTVEDREER